MGWVKLGHTTLSSAGDTITVSGMTAKKYLMVQVHTIPSGNARPIIRVYNDSESNYARRRSEEGGADATAINQTEIDIARNATEIVYSTFNIINESSKEKLVIMHNLSDNGTGAGNAPKRQEFVWKWANTTDQMTRVDVINTQTGDFDSGSELIVWGNDVSNGIVNPNLQDGTLFEETDTNKHYIWNSSTSTWTEVT